MQSYYNFDALFADLQASIEATLEKHGLNAYQALAVTAILEVIASPLKLHKLKGTPLTRPVGKAGTDAYLASLLARKVEQLKSPHSVIVNPLMDAIVAAVAKRSVVPDSELMRDTLRVFLSRPRLSDADVAPELAKNSSIEPAIQSALAYLQEGGVIARSGDDGAWRLVA